MRSLNVILAAGLLAAPLVAQNPRPSVNLDGPSAGPIFDLVLASGGDVTIAAWADNNELRIATSDGTGLSWNPSVRVDREGLLPARSRKDLDHASYVQVVGDNVYLIWEDRRASATGSGPEIDLFFRSSNSGGATPGSWNPEVPIDKGTPSGTGNVADARMVVCEGSPFDIIYILISTDPTGTTNEELFLVRSTDGGQTFSSAVPVPVGASGFDIDDIALVAHGFAVHVFWQDNRSGGDDLLYQRSIDGGVTWLVSDVQIDSSGPGTGDAEFGMDASISPDGSVIAVSWPEEITAPTGSEELRVAVSTDGGLSFSADTLVGGYIPGTDDVDNSVITQVGSNIAVAWEDNRTGGDEIYVAVSSDGGASWTETQASSTGAGFPRFSKVESGADPSSRALAWSGGGSPENSFVSLTTDGGKTWNAGLIVSDTAGDSDFTECSLNALYNNVMVAWLSDDLGSNNVYAGGVRPQTLTPNGWTAGLSTVSFDAEAFDPANQQLVWALICGGTNPTIILNDGRLLGVTTDPILIASLELATAGLFATVVGQDGTGSTPTIQASLPAGVTLFAIGLGVNPVTQTFGEITDIVEIVL